MKRFVLLKITLLLSICLAAVGIALPVSADTELPDWLTEKSYIPPAKTVIANINFDDMNLTEGNALVGGSDTESYTIGGPASLKPASVSANQVFAAQDGDNTYVAVDTANASINFTPASRFDGAKSLVVSFKIKNPNIGGPSNGVRIYLKGTNMFTQYWERRDGSFTADANSIGADGQKLGYSGALISYMGGDIYTVGNQKIGEVSNPDAWTQFDIKITWLESNTADNLIKVDYIAVNGEKTATNISLRILKAGSENWLNFDRIGSLGILASISAGAEVSEIGIDDIVVYEPMEPVLNVTTAYSGFGIDFDTLDRSKVSMRLNLPCYIEDEQKIKVYENADDITDYVSLAGNNLEIGLTSPLKDDASYRFVLDGLCTEYCDIVNKYEDSFTAQKYMLSEPSISVNGGNISSEVEFTGEMPKNGAALILAAYKDGKFLGFAKKDLVSGLNTVQYSGGDADSAVTFAVTNLLDFDLISTVKKLGIN